MKVYRVNDMIIVWIKKVLLIVDNNQMMIAFIAVIQARIV